MWSRLTLWAVTIGVVIACIAAALRFAGLVREPLFVDEAFSAKFSAAPLHRMLDLTARDTHPPLYYLGLSAWRRPFGDSLYSLRSFSVLWSLAGLGGLALLARQLVGDRGAVLTVLAVAAVHPLDVHFARTARMYSLFVALSTLASWLLWRWMDCAAGGDRARVVRWALAYGTLAGLMLYTHYLASVLLVAHGVFALAYFARKRYWFSFGAYLGCGVTAAAAFTPWILRVLHFRGGLYSAGHLRWIPAPGVEDGVGILVEELMWGLTPFEAPWTQFMLTVALCCVGGATFLLVKSFVRPESDSRANGLAARGFRVGYAAWLLFGPVGLAMGVSWIYHPIFYPPRFALLVLPPFLILLGLAFAEINSVRWRQILVTVFVGLMLISTAVETVEISTARLDGFVQLWRVDPEPDLVTFFPASTAKSVSFYLGQRVRSASRKDVESLVITGAPARLWVCTTREWRQRSSPDTEFREWLLARGPGRMLLNADGLEVVEVELGQADPMATEPTPGGDR